VYALFCGFVTGSETTNVKSMNIPNQIYYPNNIGGADGDNKLIFKILNEESNRWM
jgi:hypothetical protein